MFASVYKMQIKPGREAELQALGDTWNRERASLVKGFVSSYIIQSNKKEGEFWGVAIFDSQENYYRNASDPAQHNWYLQMRELLESDPEWNDGPVVEAVHSTRKEPVSL